MPTLASSLLYPVSSILMNILLILLAVFNLSRVPPLILCNHTTHPPTFQVGFDVLSGFIWIHTAAELTLRFLLILSLSELSQRWLQHYWPLKKRLDCLDTGILLQYSLYYNVLFMTMFSLVCNHLNIRIVATETCISTDATGFLSPCCAAIFLQ